MREIGSEFWDVPVQDGDNGIFPEQTQWYLSGRSALQAIVRELDRSRPVHLPSWCCDSMIRPFTDAGLTVRFYSSLPGDGAPAHLPAENGDTVLLMDHFGYSGAPSLREDFQGYVIRDVTHSLFSAPHSDADAYFGSLRKWCGVWTGGFAWTRDGHPLRKAGPGGDDYIRLRREAMQAKERYILDRPGPDGKQPGKEYLGIFAEAEDLLENCGIEAADPRDAALARRLDAAFIKERRRANAAILRDAFSEWLLFSEMKETDCPLFVPVLVPDGKRDALRQYLTDRNIYCPVHWPLSRLHAPDEKLEKLLAGELSLVCDQRYTEQDMRRIAQAAADFLKRRGACSRF